MQALERIRSFYGPELLSRTGTLASLKSFSGAGGSAANPAGNVTGSGIGVGAAAAARAGAADLVIDPYTLEYDTSSSSEEEGGGRDADDDGAGSFTGSLRVLSRAASAASLASSSFRSAASSGGGGACAGGVPSLGHVPSTRSMTTGTASRRRSNRAASNHRPQPQSDGRGYTNAVAPVVGRSEAQLQKQGQRRGQGQGLQTAQLQLRAEAYDRLGLHPSPRGAMAAGAAATTATAAAAAALQVSGATAAAKCPRRPRSSASSIGSSAAAADASGPGGTGAGDGARHSSQQQRSRRPRPGSLAARLQPAAVHKRLRRKRGWDFAVQDQEIDFAVGRGRAHVLTQLPAGLTSAAGEAAEAEAAVLDWNEDLDWDVWRAEQEDEDEEGGGGRGAHAPPKPGPTLGAIRTYAAAQAPAVIRAERLRRGRRLARVTRQQVLVRGRLKGAKRRELGRKIQKLDVREWFASRKLAPPPPPLHPAVRRVVAQWFSLVDSDGGGSLNAAELTAALQSSNISFAPEDVAEMIGLMDVDGDGVISWREFEAFFMYEFAAGKNLLSGDYVLPSGVALPFGAMIARLRRERLLGDLMQGGASRARWRAVAEDPMLLEDELGMMAAVELAVEEMQDPAIARQRARAAQALEKLPPHLRSASVARHLTHHPEIADKLLRTNTLSAVILAAGGAAAGSAAGTAAAAAASMRRGGGKAPTSGIGLISGWTTAASSAATSRQASLSAAATMSRLMSLGGGATGGAAGGHSFGAGAAGGGGSMAGGGGSRTAAGGKDLNVVLALAQGLEWPVEGASLYSRAARKTARQAASVRPKDKAARQAMATAATAAVERFMMGRGGGPAAAAAGDSVTDASGGAETTGALQQGAAEDSSATGAHCCSHTPGSSISSDDGGGLLLVTGRSSMPRRQQASGWVRAAEAATGSTGGADGTGRGVGPERRGSSMRKLSNVSRLAFLRKSHSGASGAASARGANSHNRRAKGLHGSGSGVWGLGWTAVGAGGGGDSTEDDSERGSSSSGGGTGSSSEEEVLPWMVNAKQREEEERQEQRAAQLQAAVTQAAGLAESDQSDEEGMWVSPLLKRWLLQQRRQQQVAEQQAAAADRDVISALQTLAEGGGAAEAAATADGAAGLTGTAAAAEEDAVAAVPLPALQQSSSSNLQPTLAAGGHGGGEEGVLLASTERDVYVRELLVRASQGRSSARRIRSGSSSSSDRGDSSSGGDLHGHRTQRRSESSGGDGDGASAIGPAAVAPMSSPAAGGHNKATAASSAAANIRRGGGGGAVFGLGATSSISRCASSMRRTTFAMELGRTSSDDDSCCAGELQEGMAAAAIQPAAREGPSSGLGGGHTGRGAAAAVGDGGTSTSVERQPSSSRLRWRPQDPGCGPPSLGSGGTGLMRSASSMQSGGILRTASFAKARDGDDGSDSSSGPDGVPLPQASKAHGSGASGGGGGGLMRSASSMRRGGILRAASFAKARDGDDGSDSSSGPDGVPLPQASKAHGSGASGGGGGGLMRSASSMRRGGILRTASFAKARDGDDGSDSSSGPDGVPLPQASKAHGSGASGGGGGGLMRSASSMRRGGILRAASFAKARDGDDGSDSSSGPDGVPLPQASKAHGSGASGGGGGGLMRSASSMRRGGILRTASFAKARDGDDGSDSSSGPDGVPLPQASKAHGSGASGGGGGGLMRSASSMRRGGILRAASFAKARDGDDGSDSSSGPDGVPLPQASKAHGSGASGGGGGGLMRSASSMRRGGILRAASFAKARDGDDGSDSSSGPEGVPLLQVPRGHPPPAAAPLRGLDPEEARLQMEEAALGLSKEQLRHDVHRGFDAGRPATRDFADALVRMRSAAAVLVHSLRQQHQRQPQPAQEQQPPQDAARLPGVPNGAADTPAPMSGVTASLTDSAGGAAGAATGSAEPALEVPGALEDVAAGLGLQQQPSGSPTLLSPAEGRHLQTGGKEVQQRQAAPLQHPARATAVVRRVDALLATGLAGRRMIPPAALHSSEPSSASTAQWPGPYRLSGEHSYGCSSSAASPALTPEASAASSALSVRCLGATAGAVCGAGNSPQRGKQLPATTLHSGQPRRRARHQSHSPQLQQALGPLPPLELTDQYPRHQQQMMDPRVRALMQRRRTVAAIVFTEPPAAQHSAAPHQPQSPAARAATDDGHGGAALQVASGDGGSPAHAAHPPHDGRPPDPHIATAAATVFGPAAVLLARGRRGLGSHAAVSHGGAGDAGAVFGAAAAAGRSRSSMGFYPQQQPQLPRIVNLNSPQPAAAGIPLPVLLPALRSPQAPVAAISGALAPGSSLLPPCGGVQAWMHDDVLIPPSLSGSGSSGSPRGCRPERQRQVGVSDALLALPAAMEGSGQGSAPRRGIQDDIAACGLPLPPLLEAGFAWNDTLPRPGSETALAMEGWSHCSSDVQGFPGVIRGRLTQVGLAEAEQPHPSTHHDDGIRQGTSPAGRVSSEAAQGSTVKPATPALARMERSGAPVPSSCGSGSSSGSGGGSGSGGSLAFSSRSHGGGVAGLLEVLPLPLQSGAGLRTSLISGNQQLPTPSRLKGSASIPGLGSQSLQNVASGLAVQAPLSAALTAASAALAAKSTAGAPTLGGLLGLCGGQIGCAFSAPVEAELAWKQPHGTAAGHGAALSPVLLLPLPHTDDINRPGSPIAAGGASPGISSNTIATTPGNTGRMLFPPAAAAGAPPVESSGVSSGPAESGPLDTAALTAGIFASASGDLGDMAAQVGTPSLPDMGPLGSPALAVGRARDRPQVAAAAVGQADGGVSGRAAMGGGTSAGTPGRHASAVVVGGGIIPPRLPQLAVLASGGVHPPPVAHVSHPSSALGLPLTGAERSRRSALMSGDTARKGGDCAQHRAGKDASSMEILLAPAAFAKPLDSGHASPSLGPVMKRTLEY